MPKYFVKSADGTVAGPVSGKEVLRLAKDGRIDANTLIQQAGSSSWHPAGDVPLIAAELARPDAVPTPSPRQEPKASASSGGSEPPLISFCFKRLEGDPPEGWQEAMNEETDQMLALQDPIENLMPIVRRTSRTGDGEALRREFCPGFDLTLVFNHQYLTRQALIRDAKRFGLSADACFDRAMRNLLDVIHRGGWGFASADWCIGELTCPEPELTSGLLACPSFMQELRDRIGDRILAAVPTRHTVLVAPYAPDTEIVFRNVVRRRWGCRDFKPVARQPLCWSADSGTWLAVGTS